MKRKRTSARVMGVTEAQFRQMMLAKVIRPASLEDVEGTHHQRLLYRHPRTGQYWVRVA